MITMTLEEFRAAIAAQGAETKADVKFICPMCETHQSGNDLIAVGAGASFEEVENYIGFSCVGRFTGAEAPRKEPDGEPCNWTLGGLFRLHKLEVVMPDGERHPHFEVAGMATGEGHAA